MTGKSNSELKMRTVSSKLAPALLASALMLSMSGMAFALEIQTKVSKVDPTGAVELALPTGTKVEIGDKVRIGISTGDEAAKIKTRWTVKALLGETIVAIPDGTPTTNPEVGFTASINTAAEQPEKPVETVDASQTDPVKKLTASANQEPETEPKPETEIKPVAADPASETASATVQDENEKTSPAPETASKETGSNDAKDQTPEPASAGLAVSQDETVAKRADTSDEAPEKQPKVKAEPATEEKPAKGELLGSLPAVEPAATASDPHACDKLAAHPFDPESKASGVSYARLNARKAIEACEQAIATFPEESRFYTQLTRGLHKAGRMSEAYKITKKGAELGSAQSMAYLGVMYKQGTAVAEDLAASLSWFEKAAEKGNPGGMVFAASMYRDGTGAPRNYKRAAELYQMAADIDVAEAMTSLAIFLDRGHGMEKDADEAARYFLKALKGQDKEAQKLLYEAPGAVSLATRKQIQSRLKSEGFYRGRIDGEFGSGTRNALTLFRRARK